MGKRSNFERVPRDFYPTPKEAVEPLLPFLPSRSWSFYEPCAGNGVLAWHLAKGIDQSCFFLMSDIEPQVSGIEKKDALTLTEKDVEGCEYIITNPPWDRGILHPLIDRFRTLLPTWLLFDADWMHTKQATPYLKNCEKIVSVGRVKWIPDSKMTGKDNCCWYLFSNEYKNNFVPTEFFGR